MVSSEKEEVRFSKTVKIKSGNPVEQWLQQVQDFMKESLKKYIKQGVSDYLDHDRKDWVMKHYGQVVAVGAQIMWTDTTE